MIVELFSNWFAPSDEVMKNKLQSISGRRFKKGVHEIEDVLKDYLPKDAKILKDIPPEKLQPEGPSLRELDFERTSGDLVIQQLEEAEAAALKVKQDRMAKARAAKGAKKGNATVK